MSVYNSLNTRESKSQDDFLEHHDMIFGLLTEVQRDRIKENYQAYKESCKSRNEKADDFYLYCLKHVELTVVK